MSKNNLKRKFNLVEYLNDINNNINEADIKKHNIINNNTSVDKSNPVINTSSNINLYNDEKIENKELSFDCNHVERTSIKIVQYLIDQFNLSQPKDQKLMLFEHLTGRLSDIS